MILSFCRWDVKFLIASKSLHKPVVGTFARMIECIPVARPQDLAFPGDGKIKFVSAEEVIGIGTKFLTQAQQGANLYIKGEIPD